MKEKEIKIFNKGNRNIQLSELTLAPNAHATVKESEAKKILKLFPKEVINIHSSEEVNVTDYKELFEASDEENKALVAENNALKEENKSLKEMLNSMQGETDEDESPEPETLEDK